MSDEEKKIDEPLAEKSLKGTSSFPVASFLITGELRPHVAVFFAFARELDDLSDNADIMPADKLAHVSEMEAILLDKINDPAYENSLRMAASLKLTGVSNIHCLDMIKAAKLDTTKSRYENWDELLDYCSLSAAPVGRYLLDLHNENEKIYPLSDALCSSLQIINHIQDCKEDYLNLDRVYLPQDFLTEYGVPLSDFEQNVCSEQLRKVIDICLDRVDILLESASSLPKEVSSKTLGMETAVIIKIAKKLTKGLRREDPLSGPVQLNRFQYISAGFRGVFSFPRA